MANEIGTLEAGKKRGTSILGIRAKEEITKQRCDDENDKTLVLKVEEGGRLVCASTAALD